MNDWYCSVIFSGVFFQIQYCCKLLMRVFLVVWSWLNQDQTCYSSVLWVVVVNISFQNLQTAYSSSHAYHRTFWKISSIYAIITWYFKNSKKILLFQIKKKPAKNCPIFSIDIDLLGPCPTSNKNKAEKNSQVARFANLLEDQLQQILADRHSLGTIESPFSH